jgi:hypothetical protein
MDVHDLWNGTTRDHSERWLLAGTAAVAALIEGPALAQTPANLEFRPIAYAIKPIPLDPKAINGLSEKILVSHYENNYIRVVRPPPRSVLSWQSSTTLRSRIHDQWLNARRADRHELGTVLAVIASHAGCYLGATRVTSAVSTAGGPNSPPWARPRGRFWLGDPRLFSDGQTTRQPMGCQSYDDFRRRSVGARSRHIRAWLSHGFRRQGRHLRRRLNGSGPLGQRGEAVRALQ